MITEPRAIHPAHLILVGVAITRPFMNPASSGYRWSRMTSMRSARKGHLNMDMEIKNKKLPL